MIYKRSGLLIPKNHPEYESIKKGLHRYLQMFNCNGYDEKFFFKEFPDGSILIPRFYPINNDEIIDMSPDGENISIEHHITPRNEMQKKAIDYIVNNKNGILQIACGSGKTVISIAALSIIKKRTIIVSHKDTLIKQWKAEILAHTNIKSENIGRLSSQNYKKCLDCDIILTTPQTIVYNIENDKKDFLNALQNANIGLLIIDECHTSAAAEKFSLASLFIDTKRVIGLSATPEARQDGLVDIIKYHLGEIKIFENEKKDIIVPKIYMLYFPFGCYENYKNYINFGGKFNLARYYKQLGKKGEYNKIVGNLINKAFNEGRNILVLGKNIEPLLNLCRESNIPKNDVGIFIPGAVSGNSVKKESKKLNKYNKVVEELSGNFDLLTAFLKKRVVFSTYLAGRDGNNRSDLDCLFLSTPSGNIEQSVGRIQRKHSGKKDIIVVDLVDTEGPQIGKIFKQMRGNIIPLFEYMAQKRLKIYEEKGWNVEIHKMDSNE